MQLHQFDAWDSSPDDMINNQLVRRGIKDKNVLQAFRDVDRRKFVQDELKETAYLDRPLPIGSGQTISQPYIVAYMLEKMEIQPSDRVLEIGTGSLYNAALLSKLAGRVYTIEVQRSLYEKAKKLKTELGLDKVHIKYGNGYEGWEDHAPYDAIVLTASPPEGVPEVLFAQLKEGGRLLAPVGERNQTLNLFIKKKGEIQGFPLLPVQFVPMVEEVEREPRH